MCLYDIGQSNSSQGCKIGLLQVAGICGPRSVLEVLIIAKSPQRDFNLWPSSVTMFLEWSIHSTGSHQS